MSSSSCSCKEGVCLQDKENKNKVQSYYYWLTRWGLILLSISLVFFANYLLPDNISIFVLLLTYMFISWHVILEVSSTIAEKKIPLDENGLLILASIGAFYVGKIEEAVLVMAFFRAGELLQMIAENRSRRSIKDLLLATKSKVNLIKDDKTIKVDPEDVDVGDLILIRPAERVDLDCKIVEGDSQFDTSALTGESIPQHLKTGDELKAGFINLSGVIKASVLRPYKESATYKILEIVEKAVDRKAKTELFVRRFARYYTPIVTIAALLIIVVPPLIGMRISINELIYRASLFLIISCPCALVISIPLSFYLGLGTAFSKGIIIKGANFLEQLGRIKTLVLDKTGTITKGKFTVDEIKTFNGVDEDELLILAAKAESHSNHPIAQSLVEAARNINFSGNFSVDSYNEVPGMGVIAKIEGKEVIVGNDRMLHSYTDVNHPVCCRDSTGINVVEDGVYKGYIMIGDTLREDTEESLKSLKDLGVEKIVMLTGDNEKSAEKIAKGLNIDYHARLLPEEKLERLKKIKKSVPENGSLVYVGDGINDTPALASADVGIALSDRGVEAAIEVADIAITSGGLGKLVEAVRIAKKTKKIAVENIAIVLIVKAIFLGAGLFGLATLWEAILADSGIAILAILNASRIRFWY